MTVVKSPMGLLLIEGPRDWACPCAPGGEEHLWYHLTSDLMTGFEMGFAAAQIDPWDNRCKLEVLMVEAGP